MTFTELIIKRPALLFVMFAVLILGGLFAFTKLNYELMPNFSIPTLIVTTPYPGAAPNEVEQSVTKKVEDVVSELDGLKTIVSQSYESYSVVMAEFSADTDIDEKEQEAQRKINNIKRLLPEATKASSVLKISPSDMPIMQMTATSNLKGEDFYDLVKNEIVPQLQQIPGIGQINVIGGREREIQVKIDKNKLNYYGISILQVTQTINNANLDFPTGKVKSQSEQNTVRLTGKFNSLDQLNNLAVATVPGAGVIKLSQVAEIIDGTKEISSINRLNGVDGVGIMIKKQSDANAVEISKMVKSKLENLEQKYAGNNLKVQIAEDTSIFTMEAANAVVFDLGLAIILVALVMLLFLHSFRDSLIVLVSIPTSLISTFIFMYFMGYSLNLMTLLAMSLVIGILVDDSIVVLENIHRHLTMGKNKVRAAIEGRQEIGFSALAITLVDVVVFAPIALIDNVIGDILRQYSLTIVASTMMSLLVSFTLTPFLASRFSKLNKLDRKNVFQRPLIWFEEALKQVNNIYTKALNWVLSHKLITSGIVMLLFVVTGIIMSMGILGQEMVARGDKGKFLMKFEFDKSLTISETNLKTREIETFLLSQKDVKSVYSNVGGASTSGLSSLFANGSENKSELSVELVDLKNRSRNTEDIMLDLRKQIEAMQSGVQIKSNVVGMGGTDEPIQIIINSEDSKLLMESAQKLKHMIAGMDGATDVTVSVEDGNPEISVDINRDLMAQFGLNLATVGATLQNSYSGNTDSKFRDKNNEYDINIKLDDFDKKNAEDVAKISFVNNQGKLIYLSQFADIKQNSGPSMLERKNRRASITVKSNILGITNGKLAERINKELANNPMPKGVEVKWGGDVEKQSESFAALGIALLAALILVYLVMVALYDSFVYPFVVFFSIPVAIIGALIALNLTMSSMSIFTMLGIIMLLGLVSKNGILIVDFTNKLKADGLKTKEALLEAGKERLKPILMTTIAMVIGMIPIAIAKGAGSEWKNGLGWVLIGGLTSSLILTVFVVPMMYYIVDRIKEKIELRKIAKKNLSTIHP